VFDYFTSQTEDGFKQTEICSYVVLNCLYYKVVLH